MSELSRVLYDLDTVIQRLEEYLFERYCIESDEEFDKINDILKSGIIKKESE